MPVPARVVRRPRLQRVMVRVRARDEGVNGKGGCEGVCVGVRGWEGALRCGYKV